MTTSQANPPTLGPGDEWPSIVRVGPERREEALARLLALDGGSDPEHARRFLKYARDHSVPLEHLWGRVDGRGRFQSVVLAVPGAGRTAMMFACQAISDPVRKMTAHLLDFAAQRLADGGLQLVQALLDPNEVDARATFETAGFHRLATLSYLERPLRSRLLPPEPQWPAGVSVETCEGVDEQTLVDMLDATYQHTLDCPGLRGLRTTADILAGHRAAGFFDVRLWTLLRNAGEPAGVLLLNPTSDHAGIELVYLGLAPAVRGRGLGLQLLRHGLRLVAGRPERLMTLAVDETNAPAIALYERERFRAVLRREALVRSLLQSA